jgi:hypothetical protein
MRDAVMLAIGLVVGLLIGGAFMLEQMVAHRAEVRTLRRLIPTRRPLGTYSGANSPHPLRHATLYVEVPDEVGEAWKAIGGPAA